MDIDGSEPRALKGLIKTFERNPQLKMVIEYYPKCIEELGNNPDDMLAILDKYFTYQRIPGDYNDEYWKEPNLVNTWAAGFICADGCLGINQYGTNTLQVTLSKDDECVIDTFIKELNYKGKRKTFNRFMPSGELRSYVGFGLCCFHKGAKYLNDHYNLGPQKTKRLKPTNLTNKYLNLSYFIVDYL